MHLHHTCATNKPGKGAYGKTHGLLLSWRNAKEWEKRFAELERYRAITGNCDVPVKSEQHRSLGRWVTAQRKKYRQFFGGDQLVAGSSELNIRFQRLKEIGFSFAIGSGNAKKAKHKYSTDITGFSEDKSGMTKKI